MRRYGRFVDSIWIQQRMRAKDARFARAAALLASSTPSQIPVVPTVTCGHCDRTIGTGSIQYAIGRCVCGAPFGQAEEGDRS